MTLPFQSRDKKRQTSDCIELILDHPHHFQIILHETISASSPDQLKRLSVSSPASNAFTAFFVQRLECADNGAQDGAKTSIQCWLLYSGAHCALIYIEEIAWPKSSCNRFSLPHSVGVSARQRGPARLKSQVWPRNHRVSVPSQSLRHAYTHQNSARPAPDGEHRTVNRQHHVQMIRLQNGCPPRNPHFEARGGNGRRPLFAPRALSISASTQSIPLRRSHRLQRTMPSCRSRGGTSQQSLPARTSDHFARRNSPGNTVFSTDYQKYSPVAQGSLLLLLDCVQICHSSLRELRALRG
jgi:hypothetical protein